MVTNRIFMNTISCATPYPRFCFYKDYIWLLRIFSQLFWFSLSVNYSSLLVRSFRLHLKSFSYLQRFFTSVASLLQFLFIKYSHVCPYPCSCIFQKGLYFHLISSVVHLIFIASLEHLLKDSYFIETVVNIILVSKFIFRIPLDFSS